MKSGNCSSFSNHCTKSSRKLSGDSITAWVPNPKTHPRKRAGSSTWTVIRNLPSGKASVSRTRLSHHEMPATCPSTSTCASTSSSSTLCTSLRNSRLLRFFFVELASPSTMEKSGPMCEHLIARNFFSPATTAMRYQVPLSNSKREGSTTTGVPLMTRWAI